MALRPAVFDRDVLPLDIAGVTEALAELAKAYPAGDTDPKVTTARREATAGLDLFLRDAELPPDYPAKR